MQRILREVVTFEYNMNQSISENWTFHPVTSLPFDPVKDATSYTIFPHQHASSPFPSVSKLSSYHHASIQPYFSTWHHDSLLLSVKLEQSPHIFCQTTRLFQPVLVRIEDNPFQACPTFGWPITHWERSWEWLDIGTDLVRNAVTEGDFVGIHREVLRYTWLWRDPFMNFCT